MRTRFFALAGFLALAPAAALPAQETVGKVKLAPQDFRGRQIRLEGEVVEVRALSPRSERGIYRLVDGSDPAGILVRTDHLPSSGGPFTLTARLSPELLSEGSLLLDEVDRDEARSPMLFLAGVVALIGLVGAAAALALYVRTRHNERHLHLGPPMWLIPTGGGGEQVESATGPSMRFNYRLQYIEEEKSDALDRRKRQLLAMLALAGGLGAVGGAWFMAVRREDQTRPSFVLMAPEVAEATPSPVDSSKHPDDTLRLGLAPAPAPAPSPAPAPPPPPVVIPPPAPVVAQKPVKRDTARVAVVSPRRDTTKRATSAPTPARETTAVAPVVLVQPPPPPPLQPPPPPPPAAVEHRDPVPTPAPARVDPTALSRAATTDLNAGIQRFARAVGSHDATVVSEMLEAGGDARHRDKFLQFLRDANPTASREGTDPASVGETSADAGFTMLIRWRGDFGVEKKKSVHFQATTHRKGDDWVFAGVRLLENFP